MSHVAAGPMNCCLMIQTLVGCNPAEALIGRPRSAEAVRNVVRLEKHAGNDRGSRVVSDPVPSTLQPGESESCQLRVGPRRRQATTGALMMIRLASASACRGCARPAAGLSRCNTARVRRPGPSPQGRARSTARGDLGPIRGDPLLGFQALSRGPQTVQTLVATARSRQPRSEPC
jgi:hypothetical protein